jgi:hypothetical protein
VDRLDVALRADAARDRLPYHRAVSNELFNNSSPLETLHWQVSQLCLSDA